MKMNKIWMVACMAATLIGGVYGCDDDKDFSYEGQLDLNLLNLTQAREVWDGAECNVTTDYGKVRMKRLLKTLLIS